MVFGTRPITGRKTAIIAAQKKREPIEDGVANSKQRGCIVGLPRSGTTWVGKICDSCPDTLYLHEPDYAKRLPCVPYVASVQEHGVWEPFLQQWMAEVENMGSRRTVGKKPFFSKSYVSRGADRFANLIWKNRLFLSAAAEYFTGAELSFELPRHLSTASSLIWKSVESLGRLGILASTFPDQKFLHVIRHPCGFVNSVMRGDRIKAFNKPISTSADLGLMKWALSTQVAREYDIDLGRIAESQPEERLAWFWLMMNRQAIQDGQRLNNVRTLSYDQLCDAPLAGAAEIFDFFSVSMTKQTKEFLSPVRKSSNNYFSVNKSPHVASQQWKESLPTELIDRVDAIAGEFYCSFESQSFNTDL